VVLLLLGPADEDRAVAVQPGVACLGDPAAGLPVGVAGFEVDFLSTGADVRLKPLLEHERADVGVVIAAVKADALRLLVGRERPADRD
jgi:hypothetical protein